MLILEISLHLLRMLHFLGVVIVRAEGLVISQLVTSGLRLFFMYIVERGVECLVTCHGAAVHWGKGV